MGFNDMNDLVWRVMWTIWNLIALNIGSLVHTIMFCCREWKRLENSFAVCDRVCVFWGLLRWFLFLFAVKIYWFCVSVLCMRARVSAYVISVYLSLHLSACVCVSLSLSLYFCLSLSLSVCLLVSQSISLFVFLPPSPSTPSLFRSFSRLYNLHTEID